MDLHPEIPDSIGGILRDARERAGFSQQQLANAMQYRGCKKVQQQKISDWERGKSQPKASELVLFQAIVKSQKIKEWF